MKQLGSICDDRAITFISDILCIFKIKIISGNIIWKQKADSKLTSAKNTLRFIYSLIDFRFLLVAFSGTVFSLQSSLKWYGYILLFCISYILFRIISELFEKAWNRRKLIEGFTDQGIFFTWGKRLKDNLFVPFSDINQIHLVKDKDNPRILFFCRNNAFSVSHLFLIDESTTLLKFNQVKNIEYVFRLLKEQHERHPFVDTQVQVNNRHLVLSPKAIVRLTHYYSFVIVFFACFTLIDLLDFLVFDPINIQDEIQNVEYLLGPNDNVFRTEVYTNNGYKLEIKGEQLNLEEDITLIVSPIFKRFHGSKFENQKGPNRNYLGINLGLKIILMIVSAFCSVYLLIHRGDISRVDLAFFILLPLILFILCYWLFLL